MTNEEIAIDICLVWNPRPHPVNTLCTYCTSVKKALDTKDIALEAERKKLGELEADVARLTQVCGKMRDYLNYIDQNLEGNDPAWIGETVVQALALTKPLNESGEEVKP